MARLFFNNALINTTVKKQLERKLEKYSNVNYAYAIMNKRNPVDFTVISNSRKWFEFYTQNSFQFTDPVLLMAAHRVMPFAWDENIILKLPKLFDMAKEYNMINGYTFVLHDQNSNLAVLSLSADRNIDVEERIGDDKGNIQLLLMITHEKMTSLYNDLNSKNNYHKMNRNEIFSNRENEIIYWASMGKSYQEIALILGLKLTTIKNHMGKVVRKLGVTNAKHAISIAVELQLIRTVIPNI
ncbi:helix-turn-helix transcriptional regulator [Yersinia mollaretii]|uniref:helix-turn-helix transcriptional regulator n=1 Tax=Yersinia mollaretii TaxID=33060 RepID=UPI0011A52881|nr:LuxR family transcriptional regulator [Yersinia mollaretii]